MPPSVFLCLSGDPRTLWGCLRPAAWTLQVTIFLLLRRPEPGGNSSCAISRKGTHGPLLILLDLSRIL